MIRNENETPEQFMNRDARDQWRNVQGMYLLDCFNTLTEAGTTAEAFHKFENLRNLLDLVRDPEYAAACASDSVNGDDEKAVAIADVIRDHLNESWKQHQEGRLRILREQEGTAL